MGKNRENGFNFEFSSPIFSHSHLQFSPKYTSFFKKPVVSWFLTHLSQINLTLPPPKNWANNFSGGPLVPSVDNCLDRYYADLVSAEDVQRMRVTPGLSGSFLIYIMWRSPTKGVGKYEEWLIKSSIRKRDASTDYALAIQPPQSSQHPFMLTPILLLVLFLFFLHATIFTLFVFILLPNMYRFWVDVQEHPQVRHHQQLFCCESRTCRPGVRFTYGRFQLHICKIFQNVHDVSDHQIQPPNFPLLADVECYAALRIFSRYSNANFEITKEDLPEVLGAMATMIIVESPDDHRENHGRGESETCDVVFPPKCCFSLTVLFWCCMLNLLPSLKTKHTAYSAPSYCSRSFQTRAKVGYGFVLRRACFSTEYTPQSQHSTWK